MAAIEENRKSSAEDSIVYDGQSYSGSSYDTSFRSFPAIPTSSVKGRNFLVGKVFKPSSVYDYEFRRCFPDGLLHLFVGTWNMLRRNFPKNIDDFLLPDKEEFLQEIYVVGVQEACVDLHAWEVKLQETLGTNHVLAHSVTHGVLHMAVFIRRDLIWFCTNFEVSKVTTRLVSQFKTKGAAAVSFRCFGSSFLFVTAHFCAGESQVKERIDNFVKICEKLQLPSDYDGFSKDTNDRFDFVFWMGDLNFRVMAPKNTSKLNLQDPSLYCIAEALKYDELKQAMAQGKIFSGFEEGKISFLPTYKFDPGTDIYDTIKSRSPSYTDRILFKCQTTGDLKNRQYDSVMTIRSSDHKPVFALFEVTLKPGNERASLGTGKFNREVYLEAARKRAHMKKPRHSRVCVLV